MHSAQQMPEMKAKWEGYIERERWKVRKGWERDGERKKNECEHKQKLFILGSLEGPRWNELRNRHSEVERDEWRGKEDKEREREGRRGKRCLFGCFFSGSAASSKVLNCIIRPAVHNLIKMANGSRVSLDSDAGCCGYASACCCCSCICCLYCY